MLSFNGRLFIKSGQQVVSPITRATERPAHSVVLAMTRMKSQPSGKTLADLRLLSLGRKSEAGSEDRCVVHCVQQCLTLGFGGVTGASRCVS